MNATLTFLDETLYGDILQKWEVPVESTDLTLQELIMLRVEEEVRRLHDDAMEQYFTKSKAAPKIEQLLNRHRAPKPQQQPDPEAHGYRALEAFKKKAFFVLVDNQQVDDLEEKIALRTDTTVSFVRLTPLVGG